MMSDISAAINQIGATLSTDLLAWGSAVIGLTIVYAGILYVQRIIK